MARLEVENLCKRFGSVVAVDGVSFSVDAGEILVLLGPSGCGKTTVLRCIAGLERPDGGDIRLDGQNILDLPPEKRDVGLVFQNYALFPHLTVEGNVSYGLRHGRYRLPRQARRAKVAALLDLVGLSGYERRKPHELSEGQKQRVALARALAVEPKVLLLDEPLSALDAALRKELRRELHRILKGKGITAVYVTHDQEEALVLGDRVGVMREGKLEQVDPPRRLYGRPRTVFVAQFLGRANLWPARVRKGEGSAVRVEVAGTEAVAEPLSPVQEGDEAFLFFRPEWAELGEGPFVAEVHSAEYLGDRWEVRGTVQGLPVVLHAPAPPRGPLAFRLRRALLLSA
ncbi:MAG: ABC transporter ATP-binding protein [Candidatus Bipolaricaulota bacterium]|nr:ABC transporter ATP-binding protein [Candidatus Bipolaricaulota bacterium]MDW8127007.1 ABC transporter ATP-binding protein [Candidatus Bipolaricaulota bacterium]